MMMLASIGDEGIKGITSEPISVASRSSSLFSSNLAHHCIPVQCLKEDQYERFASARPCTVMCRHQYADSDTWIVFFCLTCGPYLSLSVAFKKKELIKGYCAYISITTEMEQLLRGMQNENILIALALGATELAIQGVSTNDLFKAILRQCPDSLKGLSSSHTHLSWNHECVAFFGCAGNDLFVAIATSHSVPTMDVGVKVVQTLQLLPVEEEEEEKEEESDSSPSTAVRETSAAPQPSLAHETKPLPKAYEVYSFAGGVDKVKKKKFDLITKFVVDALTSYQKQSVPLTSPHAALELPDYFTYPPLKVRDADNQLSKKFFAMTGEDWKVLSTRYVDCYVGKCCLDADSVLFDLQLAHTWAGSNNVIVLIGGESGSGKTLEMLCGHCGKSNLVVYMRLFREVREEISGSSSIVSYDSIVCNPTLAENEIHDARNKRNAAFLELAAEFVQRAIKDSCPAIVELLKNHNNRDKMFTVRLCFDEMGSSPSLVRACCALDVTALRKRLEWGVAVEISVVAAGTGIGTVKNPGGSENKLYHLAMLTDRETPDKASVYWKMRNYLLEGHKSETRPENVRLTRLHQDVIALKDAWHDRDEREKKLQDRSVTLAGLMKAHAANTKAMSENSSFTITVEKKSLDTSNLPPLPKDPTNSPLTQEALFAAVESDSACAAALSNSRMGALFVSVVREVARHTIDNELSVATSGTNIRRTVLQRVARIFTSLNSLEGVTPQDASALLVESLRYTLFDGYVGATFDVTKLVSGRGVLVDNAVYKKEVPEGYEVLRDAMSNQPITKLIKGTNDEKGVTYFACYPKAIGRYSITPAMVVVLSTLMSNTFEENFSNIGDVFEREMAKFLYFIVQVFHGRPVRELVDFIVGPSALIGETAQEILKGDTQVAFPSLTLRIAGSKGGDDAQGREREQHISRGNAGDGVRREQDDGATNDTSTAKRDVVASAPQDAGLWSTKSGGAWIEISTPGLASADVVLHIPNVITLPFQCKDCVKPFPYREIGRAMNSMLVESKQWHDPTKERSHSSTRPVKSCSEEMIKDLDKVFQNQAGAMPTANLARLNPIANTAKDTPQNEKKVDYGQKLSDLGAPVIPILYISHADTFASGA
ncbi:Hypothetical protein, putative, partial [Bodo saltans]